MVITGFQWLSEVFNGYRGFLLAIGGFQWLSEVFNGYHGFSMVTTDNH